MSTHEHEEFEIATWPKDLNRNDSGILASAAAKSFKQHYETRPYKVDSMVEQHAMCWNDLVLLSYPCMCIKA